MKHKSGKTSSLKYCTNNFPANILSFDVDYFIELVSQILDIVISSIKYYYILWLFIFWYLLTYMMSISSTSKESHESYMTLFIYDFWRYFALYIEHIYVYVTTCLLCILFVVDITFGDKICYHTKLFEDSRGQNKTN